MSTIEVQPENDKCISPVAIGLQRESAKRCTFAFYFFFLIGVQWLTCFHRSSTVSIHLFVLKNVKCIGF